MRWIGYFDVSLFWLVVLLVVAFSMHSSSSVVFEDKSVLMENITNPEEVSRKAHCSGSSRQMEGEHSIKTVLTSGGFYENEPCKCSVTGFHDVYGINETGVVLIVY